MIEGSGFQAARLCWHRPGRRTRSGTVTCRTCLVAVEECLCVGPWSRSVDHDCSACGGSGWVSIVRGWRAVLREFVIVTDRKAKPAAPAKVETEHSSTVQRPIIDEALAKKLRLQGRRKDVSAGNFTHHCCYLCGQWLPCEMEKCTHAVCVRILPCCDPKPKPEARVSW